MQGQKLQSQKLKSQLSTVQQESQDKKQELFDQDSKITKFLKKIGVDEKDHKLFKNLQTAGN